MLCVLVRACVRACVRSCVCVCVCGGGGGVNAALPTVIYDVINMFLFSFFFLNSLAFVSGRTSVDYRLGSPFSSERLWFVDTVL